MKREPTTREIDQMSERELLVRARARMLDQVDAISTGRARLLVAGNPVLQRRARPTGEDFEAVVERVMRKTAASRALLAAS